MTNLATQVMLVFWVGVIYVTENGVFGQIGGDLGDFDQVETYTRILLHTKNGSILGGPRADSGPLIIDYPFPIHQQQLQQYSPLDYHQHHLSSQEFTRPAANLQQPQYSLITPQYSAPTGETHEKLSSLYHHLGAGIHHHAYHPKKKKKFLKKSSKFLVPLLITLIAKIAHLMPTLKLILLALFSLMLFAKKAFLVSVGTFLLVLYEHFTNKNNNNASGGLNLWKDRGQVQAAGHDAHTAYSDIGKGEHQVASDWWALEGANGTKITPREADKWRRWWAPQVKGSANGAPHLPPQLEEAVSLRDRIKQNIKRLFGGRGVER